MGKHRLPMSQEEREKRSRAMKGRKKSPETIEKMRTAQRSRPHPELHGLEARAKAALANKTSQLGLKKGIPLSEQHKENIRQKAIGRVRTVEHNKKLGLARTGEKSHFWKGGIATKNAEDRKRAMTTSEYKVWRRAVLERDNKKCSLFSDKCSGTIHVHHIKSWRDYPELRFDISNGETLCQYHHYQTDNFAGRVFTCNPLGKENF